MYLRAAHAENHIPTLRQFVKDNPLGIFFTGLESTSFPALQCSHIPWVYDIQDETSGSELGRLRGHMARPNPHAKALIEAAGEAGWIETEVMILFNGPVHHYVTPKFYVETKPNTGRVVPTWNYSAVQAYGKAKIYSNSKDEKTGSFLQRAIEDLSKQSEETLIEKAPKVVGDRAWKVSDAPMSYVELLKKNIIGIEIEVLRLEGKWKMSQELKEGDRAGVVQKFEAMGTTEGAAMAQTVEARGKLKEAKAAA